MQKWYLLLFAALLCSCVTSGDLANLENGVMQYRIESADAIRDVQLGSIDVPTYQERMKEIRAEFKGLVGEVREDVEERTKEMKDAVATAVSTAAGGGGMGLLELLIGGVTTVVGSVGATNYVRNQKYKGNGGHPPGAPPGTPPP